MKSIFTILGLFITSLSLAGMERDTTIVEFTDKEINKRIIIKNNQNKSFEIPLRLNLENLLIEMGVDSSERQVARQWVTEQLESIDSLVIKNKDGNLITVTTKNGKPIAQPTLDDEVSNEKGDFENEDDDEPISIEIGKKKNKRFFPKKDLGIYLGLNTFVGRTPEIDLRQWRSRYVAISFRRNITIAQGENAAIALSYAPEIAWHNFMFQNSIGIINESGQSTFVPLNLETEKSKLVVPHFSLPVMLHFGDLNSKLKLGVGGYVGYRFGGYSKVKSINNDRERNRDDFNMQRIKYGLTAELGIRKSVNLFVRYDLSEQFNSNQTALSGYQPLSFGIRL